MKADGIQFSLGFMKSTPTWPFGSVRSLGSPGSGGSLGYADPEVGVGYATAGGLKRSPPFFSSLVRDGVLGTRPQLAVACERHLRTFPDLPIDGHSANKRLECLEMSA